MGKSHLHFALQRSLKDIDMPGVYLSLWDNRVGLELLEMIDADAIICIDDIHVWAGNAEKERGLFALFERVKANGGQLIISSNKPPESSGFELVDLVSRLASGLVYPLYALSEDQQFQAIKLRANQRGLRIADDVIKYLLSRSTRDTNELFSLLDKIDKASLIEKRRITIPFLQSLLND